MDQDSSRGRRVAPFRGTVLSEVVEGVLQIPAVFGAFWDQDVFATSVQGESARLYPMRLWAEAEERLANECDDHPALSRLSRSLNYYGAICRVSERGELRLHDRLLKTTDLDGEVVIVGHGDHLEVWSHRRFQEELARNPLTDDDIRELSELGF